MQMLLEIGELVLQEWCNQIDVIRDATSHHAAVRDKLKNISSAL